MRKYLILLFLAIILFGCASRKVAIVKNDTKITIDSTAIVKTDSTATIQNNIVIDSQSQEIEISPIDNSKEIFINNVSYKNARIRIKNSRHKQSDTSEKKVVLIKEKTAKKTIHKKVSVKEKQTERKQVNYWLLIWLVPIYLFWKYKWEILFWINQKLRF